MIKTQSSTVANFNNMDIQSGYFSLLLADTFTFPSNIIVQNFDVTDTITGTNLFSNDITGQNYTINS